MSAQTRRVTWRELAHDPSLWIALAVFAAVVWMLIAFLPAVVGGILSMAHGGAL